VPVARASPQARVGILFWCASLSLLILIPAHRIESNSAENQKSRSSLPRSGRRKDIEGLNVEC
jgi:hypothetical protein